MIKGLYSAVSGMIAHATRQQALAHNIANLQTPGFKQVLINVQDFWKTGVNYSPANLLKENRLPYIGDLGLGAETGPEFIDFTQGGLQSTDSPYDLGMQGNGFFRVQTANGVRYTRDGRFIRDTQNNLTTVEGLKVLNNANQPITLPEGIISVNETGVISINGATAATLGVSYFANPEAELTRDQGNLYAGPDQSTGEANYHIAQGYLEMSNANPSYLMTEMVAVARSYEAAQKMVQNEDELLGKVIASLGRIG